MAVHVDQALQDICITFAEPPPIYNNLGTTALSCDKFFKLFDFISTGVNMPNIALWAAPVLPAVSSCAQLPPFTTARQECWSSKDCIRVPSSDNLTRLIGTTLLARDFLTSVNLDLINTPCKFSLKALDAARQKIKTSTPSGNGRKKRSAMMATVNLPVKMTSSSENVTIDKPGYGSCEYANKNFKGARECIKWYQRNGLLFEMYYESLEVRTYTQGATYTLVTMLSDVAGHAGLWLGMSIVTIVEFIALFFMCCNRIIRGKEMVAVDGNASGPIAKREAASKTK